MPKAIKGQKLADELARVADKLEGRYKKAFLAEIYRISKDKKLKELLDDIEAGRFSAGNPIDARLATIELDISALNALAQEAISSSAKVTNQVLRLQGSFDVVNDAVIASARALSIQLSTNLSKTVRETLRDIIVDVIEGNITRAEAVKRIQNEVGLLPEHQKAVKNYRRTLLQAGTPKAQVNRMAEAYTKRLLKYRANMISRTETARAMGIGQNNFWKQMQQRDMLPPDAKKVWITAIDERTCEFCGAMNGEEADIDGGWDTSRGYLEYPQAAHPHCRCSSGLYFPTKSAKGGSVSKFDELELELWLTTRNFLRHQHSVFKGDYAGHPFRGNQWTKVSGSKLSASTGKSALSKSLKAQETGDEKIVQAVSLYCSINNRYKKINRTLRDSKGKQVPKEAQEIDKAFEQFGVTLDKPVVVYRGAVMQQKILEKIASTGTFTEHGYSSTTLRYSLADAFSRAITPSNLSGDAPRGKSNVVFEIVLPKGMKVLAGNNRGGREEELILPRGTEFRLVSSEGGYKLEAVAP